MEPKTREARTPPRARASSDGIIWCGIWLPASVSSSFRRNGSSFHAVCPEIAAHARLAVLRAHT
jgi:hypothetical protein